DPTQIDAELGSRWAILETSLKRWPCALQAQTTLDALSKIIERNGPQPDASDVEIRIPAAMARIVDRADAPLTRFAACASAQFLAAAMLIDGDVLPERLESGRADPHVLNLMRKVRVVADGGMDARYPREWPANVTLNGPQGELTATSALPPGHPERPLSL